jgi:hypothetical protein
LRVSRSSFDEDRHTLGWESAIGWQAMLTFPSALFFWGKKFSDHIHAQLASIQAVVISDVEPRLLPEVVE